MSQTQVKIFVPDNRLMVGLLGQRDELLRLVEAAFDGVEIHVRGNEISVSGESAELVGRLFDELVFTVAPDEIVRAENNLELPERGAVRLVMEGGA